MVFHCLFFAGLVAEVPGQAISLISAMISGELSILAFVGVIIGVLVIITAITYGIRESAEFRYSMLSV